MEDANLIFREALCTRSLRISMRWGTGICDLTQRERNDTPIRDLVFSSIFSTWSISLPAHFSAQ